MVHVVITGCSGRMGSAILRFVRDEDELTLSGATDRKGAPSIGLDAGLVARLGPLEVEVMDDLAHCLSALKARPAVVIDFTSPEASVEHARICAAAGVALVVGSTGFSPEAKAQIAQAATRIPVVMAPNMSVGVTLMLRLVAEATKILGPRFEPEVMEIHHRHKKDAPSGTALRLAEVIAEARKTEHSKPAPRTAREGQVGERTPHEIGVMALRGGDVVGEHTVFFLGDGERLEVTHRATSRDTFATGAVRAGQWVATRPAGLYDMLDVLGLQHS